MARDKKKGKRREAGSGGFRRLSASLALRCSLSLFSGGFPRSDVSGSLAVFFSPPRRRSSSESRRASRSPGSSARSSAPCRLRIVVRSRARAWSLARREEESRVFVFKILKTSFFYSPVFVLFSPLFLKTKNKNDFIKHVFFLKVTFLFLKTKNKK